MAILKNIRTSRRCEIIDITSEVISEIKNNGIQSGLCTVFVPHTTCGITINENGDPDVKTDILNWMDKMVQKEGPPGVRFRHFEGNSDAHIKTILTGNSIQVIIENGTPLLGTWQGIYFCEFDGPRQRKYYVQFL